MRSIYHTKKKTYQLRTGYESDRITVANEVKSTLNKIDRQNTAAFNDTPFSIFSQAHSEYALNKNFIWFKIRPSK